MSSNIGGGPVGGSGYVEKNNNNMVNFPGGSIRSREIVENSKRAQYTREI